MDPIVVDLMEDRSDRDDTIRNDKILDTLDRRGNAHGIYSSSSSNRDHGHHRYHPYKRNVKEYLSGEFKKAKPPTFDGELKKSEDPEAWLPGMTNLFEMHDY